MYYPSHGLFKELNMLLIYDVKCSMDMFCYKSNFEFLSDIFDNIFLLKYLMFIDIIQDPSVITSIAYYLCG